MDKVDLQTGRSKVAPDYGDKTMPIAIVGMACRYPGEATDPERLWKTCAEQRDVWQTTPTERFNQGIFYHPDPGRNGTSNVRGGHFLQEHPGLFDAPFFNLTHAEATAMDPQQRLLLECSYEALENAGITLDRVIGSDTAVFMGSSCRDYADLLLDDLDRAELYQATGSGQTMLSNRISYFFDLKGPSATIDTACSSSLVALHLACNAIRAGESRQAIVGGSNLILGPSPLIALSMLRFLSPDGRCYTYDERANGFGRGEGAACIILKPLDEALKSGDTIRAVIRNSGTNQDGRTSGITLPSGKAQVELIERLYQATGLDPVKTSYVEAHGTGTAAGDPIEAASLSNVFAREKPSDEPLKVGSIKSNIGHLEGGSGIAAVVKTVLMLEKGLILPNFNFKKANPRIPMQDWKIEVPTTVQPWNTQNVRRASVNNFGFGGSNAHIIIDDARGYLSSHSLNGHCRTVDMLLVKSRLMENGISFSEEDQRTRVYVLSAFDESSGVRQAERLSKYLKQQSTHSGNFLDELAFTLGERRSVLSWRAAIPAISRSQLIDSLSLEGIKFTKAPKAVVLGFVFTGQGAQWHGMGGELIATYPVFRDSLVRADEHLKMLGAPWSLLDELAQDARASRVGSALLSQPLCTAIQIALVDLLASWNIKPASVTGHSSGEIAAAYATGALTQESALAVAYYRGVAATAIKDVKALKPGAMLAVGLSREETQPLITDLSQGVVSIACINSPTSVTVSGDDPAIEELLIILQKKGVFARKLAVDTAYHSHHMMHVVDGYLDSLRNLQTNNLPDVEFYSSVTGRRRELSELGPAYWAANMVSPVQFSDSVQNLCLGTDSKRRKRRSANAAVDVLVEIGPHSALSGPIKQNLKSNARLCSSSIEYASVLVRKTNAIDTSLGLASYLFRRGVPIDLHAINCPSGHESNRLLVDLPPYTWNHSTLYWARSLKSSGTGNVGFPRSDFLGVSVKNSNSLEPCWRNIMRTSEIPWIQDHNVQSNTVCPAACFLVMAVEAAYQRATTRGVNIIGYKLREVSIGHALVIPQTSDEVETMLSLRPYSESVRKSSDIWDEFCISSSTNGVTWIEHCRGLISVQKQTEVTEVDGGREDNEEKEEYIRMIASFEAECATKHEMNEIYMALRDLGLNFGPTFANMEKACSSSEKCIAEITIPNTAAVMPAKFEYPFILHPATLDGFIHAVFPVEISNENLDQGTPVPTFIEEMFVSHGISKEPTHKFKVYAKSERIDLGNSSSKGLEQTRNSLTVFDAEQVDYKPVVNISGLRFSSLHRESSSEFRENAQRLSYQTNWKPDPDFLSGNQLVWLSDSFRLSLKIKDQARMIQQAAFYYTERALKMVPATELPNMDPHHRKLYIVLSHFCDSVYEGQLGLFDTSSWLNVNEAGRDALCASVIPTSYEILCHIGKNLPQIFRKEVDPLALMMEGDRLEKHYRTNQLLSQSYEQAAAYIDLLANKNPYLNILEIGAGTGGATFPVLQVLGGSDGKSPRFSNYDFTDISTGFFEKVMEKTQAFGGLITFRKLDIEADPLKQGFQPGSYDLIIAANVLHATSRMENTMARVRSLLKPGGTLILIEITVKNLAASVIFGTLPGWWIGEEETREDGPLMTENEWDDLLRKANFTGLNAVLWDTPDTENHHSSTMISTATSKTVPTLSEVTIITESPSPEPCVDHLRGLLRDVGVRSKVASITGCDPANQVCIVLSELAHSVLRNPSPAQFRAIKRIFLEGAGALWVTRGALIESSAPDFNLVTGIARTVRAEKGDTMLVTLDLDPRTPLFRTSVAETIFTVFKTNFSMESMGFADLDTEYAERNGLIMIPRVVEDRALTSFVLSNTGSPIPEDQPYYQKGRPLRAEIKTPGFLDSLQFVDDVRISGILLDDFVQIDVKASGINFRDVMSASGQIDPYPLGCECAGVVVAAGKSVQDFCPGDHVIANVPGGSICNTIRASTREVEHIPQDMPFEIAASLPIIYFTAYYAVIKVARLCKDETILVHAASGGLGQAIINLSQVIGAEIFATVGTLEKKSLLITQFKIPEDHIFSSRDDTFAKGVMRRTGGKGVNVIMNSVSGDALRLTWNCIAPFGRFVELGKRDLTINSRLEMRHFEKNVTFTGLDVPLHTGHEEKRRIWCEIMSLYRKGQIKAPHPITLFGVSETEKALRIMQTGKHKGKLVLMPRPEEIVKVVPRDNSHRLLRADASYLLIGGLGGIGRALAIWMIKHGARNFIFASPSGLEKKKARDCVALLKARGAKAAVFKCDVSSITDLDRVLDESKKIMPPIRGMIHAAMVPKADLFENMSLDDYNEVMRPKVDGTWNLHNRLSKSELDFFIMLSSIVGLVGNPSQAAYVAASVFLDAFADFRNNQGLPAVSLDLGRVVGIGFVAENEAAQRGLNKLWSRDIDQEELMAMIKSAIVTPHRNGRSGSSITGLKQWEPIAGPVYNTPFFSHFRRTAMKSEQVSQEGGLAGRIREALREATSLEDAARYTCDTIIVKMSALLMVPLEDISSSKSMSEYGMDSLVAVEMRNWLIRELDATLPILELLANISLLQLSRKIVRKSRLVNPVILVGMDS